MPKKRRKREICALLKVLTLGCYEWCNRPVSATAARLDRLGAVIK